MTADDTEITLGAGKLLGLFFLLAAICGVFFSIGYSLGRTSGREQTLNDQAANTTVAAPAPATSSDNKPSAGISVKAESTPATGTGDTQTPMTFYKAVQQNSTDASQTTPDAKPATEAKAPKPGELISGKAVATSATPPVTTPVAKTTEPSRPSPVTGPGTIVVQIAAVSREDDAVALAGALRKKNYNVFVVNNPITNDKLYHVQVGPFANIQDAQAMKEKLVAEGYNPIIKR